MKSQTVKFLTISVVLNLTCLYVIGDQVEQIKRLKAHNARLQTWGKMAQDVMREQVNRENGAPMSPKVATDLEAYLILRENGLI